MRKIKLFNEENKPNLKEKEQIVNFLFHHLENFGDAKQDIEKAELIKEKYFKGLL